MISIHGVPYKIGLHNKVFRQALDGEWHLSQIPASELQALAKKSQKKAASEKLRAKWQRSYQAQKRKKQCKKCSHCGEDVKDGDMHEYCKQLIRGDLE